MGEWRNALRILWRNLLEIIHLQDPETEYNIKMNLRVMGYEDRRGIELAQDRVQ